MLKEYLLNLLRSKEISQESFASSLDISRETLNRFFNGKGNFPKKAIEKLHEIYEVPFDVIYNSQKEAENISYLESRRGKKNEVEPFLVPFVPIKAQAGYVKAYDQTIYVDALEKYALPPGVNPHGAIWRYWEVEGDSMEPEFHSGDIILASQVHQLDWENLRNFYLYVIVTEDRVLFKRIFCKNQLEWVLISANEEIAPQQLIPVESVKEVWVYRRSIVNKAPVHKEYKIKV